jgi:hypothetical protein
MKIGRNLSDSLLRSEMINRAGKLFGVLIGAFVLAASTIRAVNPLPGDGYPNQAEIDDTLTASALSPIHEHVVLWNTLGSDSAVAHSVIGPPLLPLRSLFYEDALFGRGILSTNAAPVVQIPQEVLNVD